MIYIQNKGNIKPYLQTIYMDLDDVVLNTSEAIIQVLKDRFPKDKELQNMGLKDLKYWNYSNFTKGKLYYQDMLDIFESNDFWNVLMLNKEMVDLILRWKDNYNFVFVSKGTEKNLLRKEELLRSIFYYYRYDDYGYYGIKKGESKNQINMSGGIQIDDNYRYLKDTKASIKILFRYPETNAESDYNGYRTIDGSLDNLYVVGFVNEIDQILDFNYNIQSLKIDNEELT